MEPSRHAIFLKISTVLLTCRCKKENLNVKYAKRYANQKVV